MIFKTYVSNLTFSCPNINSFIQIVSRNIQQMIPFVHYSHCAVKNGAKKGLRQLPTMEDRLCKREMKVVCVSSSRLLEAKGSIEQLH